MSLTTLSMMAGSLGSFPPTSGVTVALRSREETRRAALKAEAPYLAPGKDPAGRQELRPYQRAMRKAHMARKRRRGWA